MKTFFFIAALLASCASLAYADCLFQSNGFTYDLSSLGLLKTSKNADEFFINICNPLQASSLPSQCAGVSAQSFSGAQFNAESNSCTLLSYAEPVHASAGSSSGVTLLFSPTSKSVRQVQINLQCSSSMSIEAVFEAAESTSSIQQFTLASAAACPVAPASRATRLNNRPIIGIYTQPTNPPMSTLGAQYIAASYVKYIEAAGGRVVPIFYNSSEEELEQVFNSINGILFTGGGAEFTGAFLKSASSLFNQALAANTKGDYFPVWGTCMGFELLNVLAAGIDQSVLLGVDAENYTVPLTLTSVGASSRMFREAPANVMNSLTTLPITMNNHQLSVHTSTYQTNTRLAQFFQVLSTNVDRKGVEFVATVEAFNYPIYASQWHPEKNQFEFESTEVISHTPEAIEAMQYMARFFVNEARKNFHSFPSPQTEAATLIYNFAPVYTASIEPGFAQSYLWN